MTDADQRAAVECMARGVAADMGFRQPTVGLLRGLKIDATAALGALLDAGWHVARWRPIAEAEKDPRQRLLLQFRNDCFIGRWSRVQEARVGNGWIYQGDGLIAPTRFMPLPPPPKENAE